jgi:nanoRNase/pAp phosphatase (c-di-AMP/oligoRNAs hydrolase)
MSPHRLRPRGAKPRSIAENLQKLVSLFTAKDRVLITINADPDSLAASMAVKRLLWHRVQSVTIAHFNEIVRLNNVAMVRLLKIPLLSLQKINPEDFTRTVLVDGQPHHHEAFAEFRYDVVIDHHPITTGVDAAVVDIRPEYGATSTIMTEYLGSAKIRPSKGLATALLYGIRVDTRGFEVCTVEDIGAFRRLFPLANMNVLRKIEMSDMGLKDLRYFQQALERKRIIQDKVFSHMDSVHSPDVLVLLADFFMRCQEVAWTVVSGVYQKTLVVIIRSDGFRKNAGASAIKAFGRFGNAGGHKAMARAEIPLTTLETHLKGVDDANLGRFVIRRFRGVSEEGRELPEIRGGRGPGHA